MRPDRPRRRWAALIGGLFAVVGVALAAPRWNELDVRVQALLGPALQSQQTTFDQLPEARRAALVTGANRWLAMSPEQRVTATRQFQVWQQMNATERAAVLERRERFRQLPSDERRALLETRRQFDELPTSLQEQLRAEFEQLQPTLDGLGSPSFSAPSSPAPGDSAPLALPPSVVPGNTLNIPLLPK